MAGTGASNVPNLLQVDGYLHSPSLGWVLEPADPALLQPVRGLCRPDLRPVRHGQLPVVPGGGRRGVGGRRRSAPRHGHRRRSGDGGRGQAQISGKSQVCGCSECRGKVYKRIILSLLKIKVLTPDFFSSRHFYLGIFQEL